MTLPDDIIDDNPLIIVNEDDFSKLNDKNWSSIMNCGLFKEMRNELILNDPLPVLKIDRLGRSIHYININ